jgi:hypothetical protein
MKILLERLLDRWEAVWDVHGRPGQVLLVLVLLATGGGLTLGGFSGLGSRAAVAGVWVAVVLISVAAQVHRHRHGGLLVREARTADLEPHRNAASVWFPVSLLLAVGAGLAGGAGVSALYAAFGALILSYTPLLAYIGFVQRSDEDRGV